MRQMHSKTKTPFWGMLYTRFGCETKTGTYFGYFSRLAYVCSAIPFKRSRQELSIDVAEHKCTLKNYKNAHYPRFSFIPKTGTAFP